MRQSVPKLNLINGNKTRKKSKRAQKDSEIKTHDDFPRERGSPRPEGDESGLKKGQSAKLKMGGRKVPVASATSADPGLTCHNTPETAERQPDRPRSCRIPIRREILVCYRDMRWYMRKVEIFLSGWNWIHARSHPLLLYMIIHYCP